MVRVVLWGRHHLYVIPCPFPDPFGRGSLLTYRLRGQVRAFRVQSGHELIPVTRKVIKFWLLMSTP